jgi:hypothetical protein
MFLWLVLQDRYWTLDWLQRHGLENHGPCALCSQSAETIDHLLPGCPYSREVWFKVVQRVEWQQSTPSAGEFR